MGSAEKPKSPGAFTVSRGSPEPACCDYTRGCTRQLFFVRLFHLDHFVFGTSEARLCVPRISSTESHTEQQWHANPRALNGLTCGSDNSRGARGGSERRPAAELIWITFLAEILKRALRHSSTPSRTAKTELLRTRSPVPQRLRLNQTEPPVGRLPQIPRGYVCTSVAAAIEWANVHNQPIEGR